MTPTSPPAPVERAALTCPTEQEGTARAVIWTQTTLQPPETSLVWLSPFHPHSTPDLGRPAPARSERGEVGLTFTRRRNAPTNTWVPDSQPAPFSPVSQFEGFLLTLSLRLSLSLLGQPNSHLIWSSYSTSPTLEPLPVPHLPSRISHALVPCPHFCPLKGSASISNFTRCRRSSSSLYSGPTTPSLLLMPHMQLLIFS